MFSIARNTVLDYFRTNNTLNGLTMLNTEEEEYFLKHTEKDCSLSPILNLDKMYRPPLFLADVKDIKHRDISTQLGIPLSTFKSRIQRARKKIAKGYMDCCGYTLNEKVVLVGEMQNREDCKICH